MRQTTIVLTLLISQFAAKAQNEFGLKANIGLSKISSENTVEISNPRNFQFQYLFAPSGQLGVFYMKQCGMKSIIGADLLLNQIEGLEKINSSAMKSKNNTWTNFTYLGLPIYYGYKTNKITFTLGLQINYKLISSSRTKASYTDTLGNIITSVSSQHYKLPRIVENFDYGARAGLIYNLSKKLGIEGTYYYGFNHFENGTKWNIQQITLGLRYKFNANKKGLAKEK